MRKNSHWNPPNLARDILPFFSAGLITGQTYYSDPRFSFSTLYIFSACQGVTLSILSFSSPVFLFLLAIILWKSPPQFCPFFFFF